MNTEEGVKGGTVAVFEDGGNHPKSRNAGSPETLTKAGGGFSPRASRREHSSDDTLMLATKPFLDYLQNPGINGCRFKPLRRWFRCYSSNRRLPESLHPAVIRFPPARGTVASASREGSHPRDALKFVQSGGVRLDTEALLECSIRESPLVAVGQEGRKGRASVPEQQEGPDLLGGTRGSSLSLQQPSKKQNKRRPERECGSRLP